MKKQLLIVDDEERITRYLCRVLRSGDYEVHPASSGAEGQKVLESGPIDMIISDMRMPEMNGYELLSYVKQRYPHIIRIILSGDSDRNTIIKAVADGTARSYLTKPINNDALRSHLARLFATHDRLHAQRLTMAIETIESMPVIPSLYERFLILIQENKSMEDIAQFISSDPEYAAKILRVANSSLYGVRIGSISQALVYLGLETVTNLILSTELFRSFIQSGTDRREIEQLWEHSQMVNRIFHGIYHKIHNATVPNEYACCGLLHDTGILLMAKHFPAQYHEIRSKVEKDKVSMERAEQIVLGITHASLGAYLLDWWNLPQSIIEACLYHHDPLNKALVNEEMCAMVHVADFYSWKNIGRANAAELCEDALKRISVDRALIEGIAADLLNTTTENDL